jgi:hypothetical protein
MYIYILRRRMSLWDSHHQVDSMQLAQALVQLVGGLARPNEAATGRHRPGPSGPLYARRETAGIFSNDGYQRYEPEMSLSDYPADGAGVGPNHYGEDAWDIPDTRRQPLMGDDSWPEYESRDSYGVSRAALFKRPSAGPLPVRSDAKFSTVIKDGQGNRKTVVGSVNRRKPTEQTVEEKKAAVSKLWAGYRGADFDVVPQKYLFCRDCKVW